LTFPDVLQSTAETVGFGVEGLKQLKKVSKK